MTPNERALIEDLFTRIRSTAMPGRDAEAERLIEAEMARSPGAAYALAQTVLVQDQALRESHARQERLEAEPAGERDEAPQAQAGGSVLDQGLPGRRSPVPRAGGAMGAGQPEPPAAERGGGFLSGALQTAAGVAGGALLFEGVRSLFGGGGGANAAGGAGGGLLGALGSSQWGNAKGKDDKGGQDGKDAQDDKTGQDDKTEQANDPHDDLDPDGDDPDGFDDWSNDDDFDTA
jgi:hypothetical protein